LALYDDGDNLGVFIKDGGNVGIGTTDPGRKLHVEGDMRLTGAFYDAADSAGSSSQILSSTGTGTSWVDITSIGVAGSGIENYLPLWLSGGKTLGDSLLYTAGGNIGIGTTAPLGKLDVDGTIRMTGFDMPTGATLDYALVSDNSGVGTWKDISSTAGPWTLSGVTNLYPDSATYNVAIGHTTPAAKLDVIGTAWLRGAADKTGLYVDSAGNVGIGNTAPTQALDITGTLKAERC